MDIGVGIIVLIIVVLVVRLFMVAADSVGPSPAVADKRVGPQRSSPTRGGSKLGRLS
jgi:hypothetical protein